MGRKIEKFKVTKESRADVVKYFDNPKYRYFGFTCRFNRDISKKPFKIGILFKSKETPSQQYFFKLKEKFRINSRNNFFLTIHSIDKHKVFFNKIL
jgi:hypothetical protein